MFESFIAYWPIWVLFTEFIILYGAYRYIFADIVVSKWEDKVQRDNGEWLVGLLSPVIDSVTDTILDNAPDVIIGAIKQELLSNQGSLTRIGNAKSEDIGITGLQYIESLLKDVGLKSPSIGLVMKLANSIGGLSDDGPQGAKSEVTKLEVGSNLFKN